MTIYVVFVVSLWFFSLFRHVQEWYDLGMAETRKRRNIKRAVMAVAGVVLLLVWYVGMWLAISRAEYAGRISSATVQYVRPAFIPLMKYCDSDAPGADLLTHVWWKINPPIHVTGHGVMVYEFWPTSCLRPSAPKDGLFP